MKKLCALGILTIAAVAVWLAIPAEEAEAFNCYECMLGGTTLPAWGMGSSCQAAVNDAIALAEAQIPASCDTCQVIPIEVTPCHVCGTDPNDPDDCIDANDYRADYKVRYKCNVDMCM